MLTPAKKEFIEFMMSADVLRFGDVYKRQVVGEVKAYSGKSIEVR